ncbi:MAG: response regulator [Bacteroidia bacterium]|nr:response regulator [Bacteroidia bacterium]
MEKRILIIDDDKKVARMLYRRIKRMGIEPVLVNTGKEGLEKSIELEPELILLDIRMPGMDGYTVAKKLRERGYPGIIVACSASIGAKETQLTTEAGCDDFIAKPIDEHFENKILTLIS